MPRRAKQGTGPPSSLPALGTVGATWGSNRASSCAGAQQHSAASAGILLGSGEFSPPPALPLPLCFLAEASVPFHRRGGAEQEPACAAGASRRERDAVWQGCRGRASSLPSSGGQPAASRVSSPWAVPPAKQGFEPLVSAAKPSFAWAAFLHLATSGVSWVRRGWSSAWLRGGSGSRLQFSFALSPPEQAPEIRPAPGAAETDTAVAEDCLGCACFSVYLISRLPTGTEFLNRILGLALVKGSNYLRALSIFICCPYLRRPGLHWLEFQVISVAVTSLLRLLSLLAVPHRPPLPSPAAASKNETGRQRQRSVNLGCPPREWLLHGISLPCLLQVSWAPG